MTQPVGGAIPCGSSFTLSVTATGLPPLAYQWWLNLAPLADATNSSFSLIGSAATAGDYTVVVSNTDGSVTSTVATVTIVDTNPPVIVCSTSITIECAGPPGTAVSFVTTATDTCDTNVALDCFPPSGALFPLGVTTVVCVATDDNGNTNTCMFTVRVQDTTPPQITCPANINAAEFPRDGGSAVVTFAAPVSSDICDNSLTVACVPPSGTNFPVGYTSVTCEARDDTGNSNSCAFVIRVIPYRLRVTTTADAGTGSFRQALLDANDGPGENLIEFQLPGTGPFVLSPSSPLPVVTSPVILDGWSQPGFSGVPMIEMNGAGAPGADGLVIHSPSNVVRGLAIHSFASAIRLESGGSSVIQGNYLGTDATGTNAPGNEVNGLFIGSAGNVVRGNVLSGNHGAGLQLAGVDTVSNRVQGNIIGLTANGRFALGNLQHGILINSNASRNVIGGISAGVTNVIAFNGGNGVALNSDAGPGNTLQGNSIVNNGLLGIDLGADGPTLNDAGDGDAGPNGLQNFPILGDARSVDGVTTIDGSLDSVSDSEYRLDFYLNDAADPSGFGEGAVHIGSTVVTVANGGSQDFSVSFPLTATFVQFITATTTDPAGSTSEFSPSVRVRTPPVLDTQPAGTNAQFGQPVTLCVGASGTPPLAYQWRLNGQNIPGATDPCYTISAADTTNGGAYSVVVVNVLGAKQTTQAPLTLPLTIVPLGDNFVDRVLIEGTNGLIIWRNRAASREPDEPLHAGKPGGKSVWYKWIAPMTGVATVGTRGSTFDTLLAVYEGTVLSNLQAVAFDEDRGGFFTSGVRFNAIKDREYEIAIDGFGGAGGEFVFGWSHEDSIKMLPVIRIQPQSQTVAPGGTALFSVEALRFCGQGHPGCPDPMHFPDEELPLLTYQWTFNGVPIPDAVLASLTLSNVQPENLGTYTVQISTRYRTVESVEVSLQINETEQQVQPVQAMDKFLDAALAPVQLRLGTPGGGLFARPDGEFHPASIARGYTGTQVFNTTGSTTEGGEEPICGVLGGASEWITFVAEEPGRLYLNTDGSSYDTVMAIFRRNPTNSALLQELACDNNGGLDRRDSATNVLVQAGQTNFIVVDGVNGASGTLRLNYNLVTSSRLSSLGFTPQRAHVLRVSTHPGARFSIQTSTTLTNWTTIHTTNTPSSLFEFIDNGSIREPRRFYRALMLP
jgi:hypothetical protein